MQAWPCGVERSGRREGERERERERHESLGSLRITNKRCPEGAGEHPESHVATGSREPRGLRPYAWLNSKSRSSDLAKLLSHEGISRRGGKRGSKGGI